MVFTISRTHSLQGCSRLAESGFSLIEMMVTLVIIGILSAIAIPRTPDLTGTFDRMNARSHLLQDLKRAQAETLTKGCRGIIEIASDGASYTFGCDYLTYDTANPPSADEVAFTRQMPYMVTVSADVDRIIFNSRGQTVDADNVIITATISLLHTDGATTTSYATGTLLGTGLFHYGI